MNKWFYNEDKSMLSSLIFSNVHFFNLEVIRILDSMLYEDKPCLIQINYIRIYFHVMLSDNNLYQVLQPIDKLVNLKVTKFLSRTIDRKFSPW